MRYPQYQKHRVTTVKIQTRQEPTTMNSSYESNHPSQKYMKLDIIPFRLGISEWFYICPQPSPSFVDECVPQINKGQHLIPKENLIALLPNNTEQGNPHREPCSRTLLAHHRSMFPEKMLHVAGQCHRLQRPSWVYQRRKWALLLAPLTF